MKHRLALLAFLPAFAGVASAQVPAGGEFRVNTYTTFFQRSPSVVSEAGGNFVAAWSGMQQDGDSVGIFAQRFDAAGAPRGAEFQVNSYWTSSEVLPEVSLDAAGNFVVVWQSKVQDGSDWGIFGQRYDASGSRRGAEFRVNTYTTSYQTVPDVASDPPGNFVVVWQSIGQDGNGWGIYGQRFDAAGAARGAEFRVNTYTIDYQYMPNVATDAFGNFVVVWASLGQDGSAWGIFGQRFDSSGAPRGEEFRINTYTSSVQIAPAVAANPGGDFVVVWQSYGQDGSEYGVFGRRYDLSGVPGAEFQVNTYTTLDQYWPALAWNGSSGFVVTWQSPQGGTVSNIFAQRFSASGAPRGGEFQVNAYTSLGELMPAVASDHVGNFVVAWSKAQISPLSQDVLAQRFGGLLPAALRVDPTAGGGSDGNSVLEPMETAVDVKPSWKNVNGASQTFDGNALAFTGPAAPGVSYLLLDGAATYGTVANGATAECGDCYQIGVGFTATRPALHWDAALVERIAPDAHGQQKTWALHVGRSFSDVPKTSPYYRFVETLLHKGVTGGCGTGIYCPTSTVTREQMAPFVLVAREGSGYGPPACTTPIYGDVPASSPFCRWIEELARRGVVSGCGGGNYCPTSSVTREQMPIFVLRTLDPTLNPPACTTPVFGDVPASSPFCRWIEELARRGVVTGCGSGNYCPGSAVTREQMGVFISATFGLTLYGV